ncbi:MAG: PPOX class F420-dependent oxidoreductase [Tepidiformaceae bacterium]
MPELTAEIAAFLESMKVPGVLSTIGNDGGPVTSAVWYALREGRIVISTPTARPKARNARAHPLVSFVVDTKTMPYRGVAIEGSAEVLEDPDRGIMEFIAHRYLGPDLPAAMQARIAAHDRVIIRIEPRRVRPWNLAAPG